MSLSLTRTSATAHERTGWRDKALSLRHRDWGYNCPAVDLDFLVTEYNVGKPVALIEYKHERAKPPNLQHPTYRALRELADGYSGTDHCSPSLPFAVVTYRRDPWRFLVTPANDRAMVVFGGVRSMSERQFVSTLYEMREKVIERHVLERLDAYEAPMDSWPGYRTLEAA